MPQSKIQVSKENIVSGHRQRVMSLDGVHAMIAENKIQGLFYSKTELDSAPTNRRGSNSKTNQQEVQNIKQKEVIQKGNQKSQSSQTLAQNGSGSKTPRGRGKVTPTIEKSNANQTNKTTTQKRGRGRGNSSQKDITSQSRSRSISKKNTFPPKQQIVDSGSKINNDSTTVSKQDSVIQSIPNNVVVKNQPPAFNTIFSSQQIQDTLPITGILKSKLAAPTQKLNQTTKTPFNNNLQNQRPAFSSVPQISSGSVIKSSNIPINVPIQIKIEQ